MAKRVRFKPLSLALQEAWLRRQYPQGRTEVIGPRLYWRGKLTPTPISPLYEILVSYYLGASPEVFVLKPNLTKNEEGKLPHVYSTKDQKLCLHFPPERSWRADRVIALILMPWISEWLFFYEIWVSTTFWLGGGTHAEDNNYTDVQIVES